MSRFTKSARSIFSALGWAAGGILTLFAMVLAAKIISNAPLAQAASAVLYPRFCLGGWKDPQAAAGKPDGRSAKLEPGVSTQLFCGYFTASERTKPPTRVVVKLAWDAPTAEGSSDDVAAPDNLQPASSSQPSLDSGSGYLIATSTGFTVPYLNQNTTYIPPKDEGDRSSADVYRASTSPQTKDSQSPSEIVPEEKGSPASSTPPFGNGQTSSSDATDPSGTTSSSQGSSGSSSDGSAPASPSSSGADVPAGPTSMIIDRLLGLLAERALAATADPTESKAAFLQIGYSTDGVRWTTVGTIGPDNLKGYSVAIPVRSWSDLVNLQIMLSAVPSLAERPALSLESISAEAEYDRTVSEAITDAVGAANDTLDAAVATLTGEEKPKAPPEPRPVEIVSRKLVFRAAAASIEPEYGIERGFGLAVGAGGSSLSVSGPCTEKYFVVMLFRGPSDYANRPSSALVNSAEECRGGSFRYDLSGLSLSTPPDDYYLIVGKQGQTGKWTPVSEIFPIAIGATTTVETVMRP